MAAVAGFILGTVVGVALPWILLGMWRLVLGFNLPLRVKAFLSFLTVYTSALGGGVLIAFVSDRFELWIAGGSVLTGLAIDVIAYGPGTEHATGKKIRSYSLGFGPSFVVVAVVGALMPVF